MASNNDLIAAGVCAAYLIIVKNKKNKKKRRLQKGLLRDGVNYGNGLMNDLKLEDGSGFRNFMRMSCTDFENLFFMVGPKISKTDTKFRTINKISNNITISYHKRFLLQFDVFI